MAERYVRMNILSSGAEKAKATLDDLTARARRLEAESPDLKITANDTQAQARIKDLQLKIQILNRERAEVAFETKGDEKAKATLLDISARLRKLDETVAKPNIKVEGLDRAEAQMIRLKLAMDDLHNKRVEITLSERTGLLSKLASFFGGGKGGGGGGIGNLAGEGGGGAGSGILSSIGGANNQYTGGAIAALIAAALSVSPALIPFGIGGGIGALGGIGAYKLDPKAFTSLISDAESGFLNSLTNNNSTGRSQIGNRVSSGGVSGTSFISGLLPILKQVDTFIKQISPELTDMFKSSLPFISTFAKIFEQLAALLLPSFTVSMKEITPYLPQIAEGFKSLSQGIADFIVDLGPGMRDGVTVFKALMVLVKGLLIALAGTADILAIAFARLGNHMAETADFMRGVWDAFRHWMANSFDGLRHEVAAIWDDIWNDTLGTELKWTRKLFDLTASWRHGVAGNFDDMRHDVAAIWDSMWDAIRQKLGSNVSAAMNELVGLEHHVVSIFDGIKHTVIDLWNTLWFDVTTKISGAVAEIGRIWSGITSVFSGPIHAVESIWDRLAGVWNHVASAVGAGGLSLPQFAMGGRIGVGTTGTADDVLIRASKGETVLSATHSSILAPLLARIGVPGYAAGGIPLPVAGHGGGVPGNQGSNPFSDIGSLISSLAHDARADAIKLLFAPINFLLGHLGGGVIGGVLGDVVKSLENSIAGIAQAGAKKQASSTSAYTGGYGPGVTQWTGAVLKVLAMLGLPSTDVGTVLTQMMTESGGNPNAINLTDSNAAAGDPSRGLMQTIMSTFEAYRSWTFPNDIFNPIANIFAGVNYAIHRYGNPGWLNVLGHGHGYAGGGWINEPIAGVGMRSGMRYTLGENEPEYVTPRSRMHGGGGDTYNISFNGVVGDPEAVALQIVQTVRRYKKHHGNQSTGIG
jgi:hypothetical protein